MSLIKIDAADKALFAVGAVMIVLALIGHLTGLDWISQFALGATIMASMIYLSATIYRGLVEVTTDENGRMFSEDGSER